MRKSVLLFLVVLLGVSLSLAGCNHSSKELTKVRLCEVTHSVFYAPQYVALTQGFFQERVSMFITKAKLTMGLSLPS